MCFQTSQINPFYPTSVNHGSGMGQIAITPSALTEVCANFCWYKPTPTITKPLPDQTDLSCHYRGLMAPPGLSPSAPPCTAPHSTWHFFSKHTFGLKYHICFPILLYSCLSKWMNAVKLNREKTSNIINNSNLPLESFTFLPAPRGGWCGLCIANRCQTQHCLLLKIYLLRIWCLHIFLELLHEYFLQKQFIHKVFQIIKKSVTSSFKTWPGWSGACSHSTLCCRGTAGETALASHFWPGQSHLGYWTHEALNITSKRKHFFRDLLWKANAKLLSLRLCKGSLPGPCQNSLKEHWHFGPVKHIPAVLPSCLLLGVAIWRQLHWYNIIGNWWIFMPT